MFYKEVVTYLICVLPQVLATSCTPKCGIPSEWLPVASNVCYGTKGDKFGKFAMNRNWKLYAIRFVHVFGFQSDFKYAVSDRSRWGHDAHRPTRICTLLLKNRRLLIPRKVDNERMGLYSLKGFKVDDDVIIIKQNETFTKGQELEIAFGYDFKDLSEGYTEGTHCVNVDVSCYV